MDANLCIHVGLSSIYVNIYRRYEIQNVVNLNMCHAPGDRTVARKFSIRGFAFPLGP